MLLTADCIARALRRFVLPLALERLPRKTAEDVEELAAYAGAGFSAALGLDRHYHARARADGKAMRLHATIASNHPSLYAGWREVRVPGKTIDRLFADKQLKPGSIDAPDLMANMLAGGAVLCLPTSPIPPTLRARRQTPIFPLG